MQSVHAAGKSVITFTPSHFHLAHDLSISNRRVVLKFNRRQFKCHTCKKPFSETLDFIGDRRRYTDRFAEMIAKQVIHSDTHNVARNHGLTDDEVWKGGRVCQ